MAVKKPVTMETNDGHKLTFAVPSQLDCMRFGEAQVSDSAMPHSERFMSAAEWLAGHLIRTEFGADDPRTYDRAVSADGALAALLEVDAITVIQCASYLCAARTPDVKKSLIVPPSWLPQQTNAATAQTTPESSETVTADS